MILTCEINKKDESVEIVFDKEGYEYLGKVIRDFQKENDEKIDHKHLMTKGWGGNELTDEIMHKGNTLVNHLKLIFLKE